MSNANDYNEGIFEVIKNPKSAHFLTRKVKLERRMVDYFYEKHFQRKEKAPANATEQPPNYDHWILVVKYGSKILYLHIALDKFSDWYYSENPQVKGGRIWSWKDRDFSFRKNRAKIR